MASRIAKGLKDIGFSLTLGMMRKTIVVVFFFFFRDATSTDGDIFIRLRLLTQKRSL